MEFLTDFFNQGWVGSVIGITGLVIAFILYRASRIGPRPVYQLRALRLIGKEEQALPEEVEILFRGRSVPRLTKTHIILWNSGKAMLDGKNIVPDDPLRFEFRKGAQVLRSNVLKVTRESNKFTAMINSDSPNNVICNFDYLDAGDGAVIELLHTNEGRYPKIRGTIRGVPKGILNWGDIPSGNEPPRKILFVISFLGVIASIVAFFWQIFTDYIKWFF
ncbi:MAG: hypothetical protein O8C63_14165 [Candidatus Methanoperedens sp.]|nr:hypothetical protein [Candidatus Methanoperedens sp.]